MKQQFDHSTVRQKTRIHFFVFWKNRRLEKKTLRLCLTFTTATKYVPKRPRICIKWNPSFQTSLEVNLVSQCSNLEVLLLSKFGSERGISIDGDSGPPGYVLWCYGSRIREEFTFIQICYGHTVLDNSFSNNFSLFQLETKNSFTGAMFAIYGFHYLRI